MRKYKIIEPRQGLPKLKITYRGFDRNFVDTPQFVAIVRVEDDIESWALDAPECISELIAMFHNDGVSFQVIGIFKEFENNGTHTHPSLRT